jgi:hypothetical protein
MTTGFRTANIELDSQGAPARTLRMAHEQESRYRNHSGCSFGQDVRGFRLDRDWSRKYEAWRPYTRRYSPLSTDSESWGESSVVSVIDI